MGQTLRRALYRFPSMARTRPSEPKIMYRNPEELSTPTEDGPVPVQDFPGVSSSVDTSKIKVENKVLEERNPEYDAMLQKMLGTIKTRSGGKPEMGEARVVQTYRRALPKVRTSKDESGSHGQKPLPPGTLTVVQVQEIILLYQGKSADHTGPMDVRDIAQKFGVDAVQVENIVQFISLPSEHNEKDTR